MLKCASCVHVLLAGMVCNPCILVLSKNLGGTLQRRGGQGTPSMKGSAVGDTGTAWARILIALLQQDYQALKVSWLFLACGCAEWIHFHATFKLEAEIVSVDEDFSTLQHASQGAQVSAWVNLQFEPFKCGGVQPVRRGKFRGSPLTFPLLLR